MRKENPFAVAFYEYLEKDGVALSTKLQPLLGTSLVGKFIAEAKKAAKQAIVLAQADKEEKLWRGARPRLGGGR